MAVQSQLVYEFGRFRLIPSEHELLRDDQPLPLPPKVFDTLLALVENGGHLKEKEELIRQLWPDSFVDDASLARNISQLRKVLGTREDGGEFIETIPKRGYRFIAPVTQVKADEYLPAAAAPSLTPASAPAAEPFGSASRHNVSNRRRLPRGRLLLIGAALICIFAAATVWWTRAAARPPHVTRLQQITTSGRVEPWGRIVTDGSRIYFLERYAEHWRAMQAPAAGGPTQPVQWSIPGKNFRVLDASPDGSQFLAGSFDESDEEMPLWIEPAVGGPPVRVGNVMAYDASWVPDGQHIIYSHDRAVFLVGNSGDHQVRVAEVPGIAGWFSWSRDGKRVRFSLRDPITYRPSLWEVAVDGSGFHPVLPLSSGEADWMGQWSADARFFVFTSTRGGRQNLWAIKEGHEASPLQLTAGPNGYVGGIFSRDGKTIFAPVVDSKADVVRYDPETRRFLPFFY
jgi:DNA-binding winged helix-turn-helix (wHTH) protein